MAGVVQKFGEGCDSLGGRRRHLVEVHNYEVRSKYCPRVASKQDVSVTKLNCCRNKCDRVVLLEFIKTKFGSMELAGFWLG
ncbi:hypothetical protein AVEN_199867-1 [Araneus ventricosus]|uniref:Uncharacterized protein n=2 Tax=Araneus ventricosus TaxID=182803 RepID=A0A4Y2VHS3_ARAVE|nr:hypothetical protein AVEN_199867-1 [Araneus ventricosus]